MNFSHINMSDTSLKSFMQQFYKSYEILPQRGPVTTHQKSLLLMWMSACCYWIFNWFDGRHKVIDLATNEQEPTVPTGDAVIRIQSNEKPDRPPRPPPVALNDALLAVFTVGWIMLYYFFCDYLHYFPKADRVYNRDLFMFLFALLLIVGLVFTRKENSGVLLNRDQTEEWKGWMQIMFVWYHYFRAAETYNAVRIYIAAYVFMTGFGNFSFFWVRKDYSLRRVLKSLFRLNFLVALTCLVIDNEYILYYICAMHTFWFLSVYAMMRPFQQQNGNKKVMALKLTIYFLVVYLIFDVPGVAEIVFAPFSFFLNYGNPPILHEWIFRSGLDHYATFAGMLFAFFHPNMVTILSWIDNHRFNYAIILLAIIPISPVMFFWYKEVFMLSKYPYNLLHPYTSFIPILGYIFLRNSTARLRKTHIALFTFLGKITLETYISQLHVYLQKDAKEIIVYIPGYPLINFLFNTAIYIYISRLLFNATITLNEYIFPSDYKVMMKKLTFICAIIFIAYSFVGFSNILNKMSLL